METSIKDYVIKRYPKHRQIHSRLSSNVETKLCELLQLGTEAEEHICDMDIKIRRALSGTAPQFGQIPAAAGH